MLISRGVNLLNHTSKHAKRKNMLTNMQSARLAHKLAYRPCPEGEKNWIIASEILGGFVWWWLLYRTFHNYKDLGVHWKYPNVHEWTDEELGIPPDNSDC